MKSIISTEEYNIERLSEKVENWPGLDNVDLVKNITCKEKYEINVGNYKYHIVAYDFGIKWNILRNFKNLRCKVTVVPADTPSEEVLKLNPDGIFLSNGPGDPRPLKYAINSCRELIGKKPIFGICLGHEIIGLALGGEIYHMKFGHRGGNQPVKDLITGRTFITSENHGWALKKENLPDCLEVTRINLNDGTVEGMRHREYPVFSIQCHPEGAPGPHDSTYLFKEFLELIDAQK